ncbi:hypothetical protein [Desulfobotulus mexicanus]|uniref:Uncharacterized protein n=1 Tax=Desulfobotulus mexicanus TaxID=2586642 RepID=A0A5Q4VF20_9BACT|nr:hypothetical protein [Desulfobotulus mexicanus]TYT74862.1 hypothetical protein FIM25_08420 [Desulfobotulus mexicanus]
MSKTKPPISEQKKRQEALSSLPPSARNNLSPEEVEIFLHGDVWPEELCQKLSEFIFPLEDEKLCKDKE